MTKPKEVQQHIDRLQARLSNLYSYADGKRVDLREELEKLRYFESVYSSFMENGEKEGTTYEEYSEILDNVRSKIAKYTEIKNQVEEINTAELKNINLLIELFAQ